MKNPIRAIGIDGNETIIGFKARKIPIYVNTIPKILCFPEMRGDILLGNNFIYQHLPFSIDKNLIILFAEKIFVEIPLVENYKFVCDKNFTPPRKEQIKQLETDHWLFKILEDNFSEEPLNYGRIVLDIVK
ncbi:hypothetical protein V6Z11_A05G282600 [Gossypium hirsutum]